MRKTGYERHNFDGLHVCGSGVFVGHNDCYKLQPEQVDIKASKAVKRMAKKVCQTLLTL
jgi:hypothetical protein